MNQAVLGDICRTLAQSGLALLIQSSIVLLLGLGLGLALRRRGPLAQSVAYRATLAAVVCTALFSAVLASHLHPVWRVSLPETPQGIIAMSSDTASTDGGAWNEKIPVPLPTPPNAPPPLVPSAPPVAPSALPSPTQPSLPWTSWLYVGAVGVWSAGMLALLAWFGIGQWTLFRLRRDSKSVTSGEAWELLAELTAGCNAPRPLSLRVSPHVRSPFLAGVRQPTIYLPDTYTEGFDAAQLRAILAHETAHFERRDVAWTLTARLTCTLLWPQPLLWWLSRRMEQAAEEACDILVLTQGCAPRAYADCLLSLAERLTPSRTERSLGLGVVPFRSQVGRRIQQILSGVRHPRTLSRGLRAGIVVAALAAVALGLLLIAGSRPPGAKAAAVVPDKPQVWAAPASYLAQFSAAHGIGGSVGPIQLLPSSDKTARYPTVLTDEEKALIGQCKKIGVYNAIYRRGGPPLSDRRALESILAQHPHFFVAENLMGVWYGQAHDPHHAAAWMERALQDAPAVITGRVQFADGRPVKGYTFTPMVALCQTANGRYDHLDHYDPQNFQYPDVTTDAHGCYYLPAFRAVYEEPGWHMYPLSPPNAADRFAAQWDVMSPQTSGGVVGPFMFTTRVGVLPPMIARPFLSVKKPFGAVNQTREHPLRLSGTDLTVTWLPYPGATGYAASLTEITHIHGGTAWRSISIPGGDAHFHDVEPGTQLHLSLSGNIPTLVRTRTYELNIRVLSAGGSQIADSYQYYFQPLSGIAPQPLTKPGLTKLMPPGFIIDSVVKTAQGGTITGTMPFASDLITLLLRQLFECHSLGWDTQRISVGGSYIKRKRFRLVYSMTGNVPPGSASFAAEKAVAQSPQDMLCESHLKQINLALIHYARTHSMHFPDANRWIDELAPYVQDTSIFHDPNASTKYGYAFNQNLSGLSLYKLTGNSPQSVVIVFESIKSTRNASDTGQSLSYPKSFTEGAEFLFADGHVKRLRADQSLFFITDKRPTPKVPQLPVVLQPPTTIPQAEAVTLVGRVVFVNGKPAPGVMVYAQHSYTPHDTARWRDAVEEARGATDASGRYVLSGLSDDHYNVMMDEATGQWVAVAARDIIGKKGATVTVPDLVLTHGAWITGKVTDAKTGKPLKGIIIGNYGPARPDTSAAILYSQPTGSDGRYKLCVAAGRNEVYVCQPQAATGNYAEPGQSIRFVTVKAGETKVLPFRLAKAAPSKVR